MSSLLCSEESLLDLEVLEIDYYKFIESICSLQYLENILWDCVTRRPFIKSGELSIECLCCFPGYFAGYSASCQSRTR